jgi:GT2 family glycosyltransferase
MREPKVLISILNWNNWKSTVETVNSVLLSDYSNYAILLLDNHSPDDSVSKMKEHFPGITVKALKKNLGYAGGHKKAAMYALENKFDLLWILNNDVQVFPYTLKELVLACQRNGNALLGSMSLEADGETIHFGGGAELVDNFTIDEKLNYNQYNGKKCNAVLVKERAVSDIEGASFVIPVSIIQRFGFMDTRFFLYGEETDYCYTLRRKYNIQSVIVPAACVIHRASASFNLYPNLKYIKAYYFTRNTNLLHYKYLKQSPIEGNGGVLHYLKFFFKHYFVIASKNKNPNYWLLYYQKLGAFHALLRIKLKYLEPNNFINPV